MQVLRENPRYIIHIQRRVIAVTIALHKFIRLSNLGDVDFVSDYTNGNAPPENSDSDEDEKHIKVMHTIWKAFKIKFLHFYEIHDNFILYFQFLFKISLLNKFMCTCFDDNSF